MAVTARALPQSMAAPTEGLEHGLKGAIRYLASHSLCSSDVPLGIGRSFPAHSDRLTGLGMWPPRKSCSGGYIQRNGEPLTIGVRPMRMWRHPQGRWS